MVWLYVAILVVGFAAAFLLARLVKDQSVKRRIGGWISIVVGVAFVLIYALGPEREPYDLFVGLICLIGGVFTLLIPPAQRADAPGQS